MMRALLKTMRPRQWTKNAFIFAAIVFDGKLFHLTSLLRTVAGFGLFCLMSRTVYIFNDLMDVQADRMHPVKKNRPIASGRLPVGVAITAGIIFVVLTLGLAFLLAWQFALVLLAYFLLMMAYSRWLKHIPIVDLFVLPTGLV